MDYNDVAVTEVLLTHISVSCNISDSSIGLWHHRLGHPSKQRMRFFSSLNSEIPCGHPVTCDTCHLGKHRRLPFPTSTSVSKDIFDLLHIDVWGPFPIKSIYGHFYFLTVVDDKSRFVWIFPMVYKSEVRSLITSFYQMVETQFDRKIKCVRTDNAKEFDISEFYKSKGIIHQNSCVYTPQQNSIVEGKHQHLLNVARTLRLQAHLPLCFWTDCVLHAAYLINITPTPLLLNKTPSEMLYGQPPNFDNLRVFGCLTYASVLPKPKTKLHARTVRCMFIGFPKNMKGYRLFNLETREIFVSRDVVFSENIFPFAKEKTVFNKIVYPANENNTVTETVIRKNKVSIENGLVPPSVCDLPVFNNNTLEVPSVSVEHIASDFGQGDSVSIEHVDSDKQQPLVVPSSRPARTRKLPHHLKDYEVSLPKTRTSPHTVAQEYEMTVFG
ncbi:hypothetical protein GQ457_10G001630 [Hibiscus cannabinus]